MIQALIAKLSPNRNAAKLIEMFGSKGFLDQQFKDLGLAGMQEPATRPMSIIFRAIPRA